MLSAPPPPLPMPPLPVLATPASAPAARSLPAALPAAPSAAPPPAAVRPRLGAGLQPRQGLALHGQGTPAPGRAAAPARLPLWADAAPLELLLGACRRQGRPAALLLVELQPADPASAAALLDAVGLRLRGRVRAHDEVALTADGALAVVLRGVGELASQQLRSRLEDELRRPYRIHAGLVQPLLRIGRAVAGLDGHSGRELLRAAALPVRD